MFRIILEYYTAHKMLLECFFHSSFKLIYFKINLDKMQIIRIPLTIRTFYTLSQLQCYKYTHPNNTHSDNNKSYSHCKSVVVKHLKQFKTFYTSKTLTVSLFLSLPLCFYIEVNLHINKRIPIEISRDIIACCVVCVRSERYTIQSG